MPERPELQAFSESLKRYRDDVRKAVRGEATNDDKFEIQRFLVTARRALIDDEYRWFRLHHIINGDLVLVAAKFGFNYTKARQMDFRVREKVGAALIATKEAPHA